MLMLAAEVGHRLGPTGGAAGQAAAVYSDWDTAGENVRMLLRFIGYAEEPQRST